MIEYMKEYMLGCFKNSIEPAVACDACSSILNIISAIIITNDKTIGALKFQSSNKYICRDAENRKMTLEVRQPNGLIHFSL